MDPATIDNPWALLAFLALLGYLAWNSRKAKNHAKRGADASEIAAHEVKNNSGSSLRDAVDRIEARQEDQGDRIAVLEHAVEKRGTLERHP